MALDGIILQAITRELQPIVNAKINKIYQIFKTELIFNLRLQRENATLLVSCHSLYNRIQLTKRKYQTPDQPTNFAMLLRKHLENGTIRKIEQFDLDRYLIITVENRDDIGDLRQKYLCVELMGKYANIILCDENFKILDALLRIPPFQNAQRIIQPGAQYQKPDAFDKVNPFLATNYDPSLTFTQQFSGFSPLLSKEVSYRLSQGEDFMTIIQQLKTSQTLYLHQIQNKMEYHLIPLTHLSSTYKEMPIMAGLDYLYYQLEEKEQIKQYTGDLFKFVRREIKKAQSKLPKLQASLEAAWDCDQWRVYGDLLYSYPNVVTKGHSSIVLPDFEGNDITIPLDPRFDQKTNAKKCFQKYQKLKTAQKHLQRQIEATNQDLIYFQTIAQQLEYATINDAQEIRQELAQYGYLKQQSIPKKRKQKVAKLNYLTIPYRDDITIYVGKNNLQNDYLTFHHARKHHYWFHTKDYHGAHIIVTTDVLDEPLIRLCATLAAYFSQGKDSSSIPVNYTQIKNIKKIPNTRLGFVALSHYKTIYIDIDETLLAPYIELN